MIQESMVIIFTPSGEKKFTTSKEVSGDEYALVQFIDTDLSMVRVQWISDGKKETEIYRGMPYVQSFWSND